MEIEALFSRAERSLMVRTNRVSPPFINIVEECQLNNERENIKTIQSVLIETFFSVTH